jgi:hypothetical protein
LGPNGVSKVTIRQHMERDPDLAAVRDRADYKQLLADLARKP